MSEVRVDRQHHCVTLTLDNPARRNAMDAALLASLEQEALAAARDESAKVVILRGSGTRAFCSGADLDAMRAPPVAASVAHMEALLKRAIDAIGKIDVPVIAAIQGACIGGGVQLALCADIRVASGASTFAIPAAQVGLPYPFEALQKIARLMGEGKAKAFLLGLQKLDAQQAMLAGLIEVAAPPDDFEATLATMTNAITGLPRDSAIAYKRMLSAIAAGDIESAMQSHAGLLAKGLYLSALGDMPARKASKSAGDV